MEQLTLLDAVKGETTLLNLEDLNITIDTGVDQIWFTAKKHKSDLDADAIIRKGLNVSGLSGISVIPGPPQVVQITLSATDLPVTLVDRALVYDLKIKQDTVVDTVVSGVLYLVDSVNQSAA